MLSSISSEGNFMKRASFMVNVLEIAQLRYLKRKNRYFLKVQYENNVEYIAVTSFVLRVL